MDPSIYHLYATAVHGQQKRSNTKEANWGTGKQAVSENVAAGDDFELNLANSFAVVYWSMKRFYNFPL